MFRLSALSVIRTATYPLVGSMIGCAATTLRSPKKAMTELSNVIELTTTAMMANSENRKSFLFLMRTYLMTVTSLVVLLLMLPNSVINRGTVATPICRVEI